MLVSLSESIRKRRKELKLSQSSLAGIAGLSSNTISLIERGEANPSLEVMQKIADVLGMVLKLEIRNSNVIDNEDRSGISK